MQDKNSIIQLEIIVDDAGVSIFNTIRIFSYDLVIIQYVTAYPQTIYDRLQF